MRRNARNKQGEAEVKAIGLSLGLLAVGLLVAWFVTEVIGEASDGVTIALLALPVLAYLALTGRLLEISGPGNFSAKFQAAADKPAETKLSEAADAAALMTEKLGLRQLERQLPSERSSDPMVLTFRLFDEGPPAADDELEVEHELQGAGYSPFAVSSYVKALMARTHFVLVVFLDPEGRVVGHVAAKDFARVADDSNASSQEFFTGLNDPNSLSWAKAHPAIRHESVREGVSNAGALEALRAAGSDALPVVDSRGQLSGVVERERVVADMLLEPVR